MKNKDIIAEAFSKEYFILVKGEILKCYISSYDIPNPIDYKDRNLKIKYNLFSLLDNRITFTTTRKYIFKSPEDLCVNLIKKYQKKWK